MATHQQSTAETHRCAECGDVIVPEDGLLTCRECRHAPRHGAD
jgi:hypothetical protein